MALLPVSAQSEVHWKPFMRKSLKAGLKTPAIIVVGETAAFDLRSEEMTGDKIDDKPLSGLQSGSPVPLLLQPV